MPRTLMNQQELDHLAKVVAEVESQTSGEIRLMIVSRSARTGHVVTLLWFFLMALAMAAVWYQRHRMIFNADWWLLPLVISGSLLVAWILARIPWVERQLLWPSDVLAQVWARAELEFHREGLGQTAGRTGILLFLSLREHQAVVLADKGIAAKLDKHTWENVINVILEGAKSGQWSTKMEEAIRLCGRLLAEHFPIRPGDKNELPNHVILKE
ncbi:MAG: TPM domain-containing protein [Bdellovibrionales bacterium]